jgi:hypothetical protein
MNKYGNYRPATARTTNDATSVFQPAGPVSTNVKITPTYKPAQLSDVKAAALEQLKEITGSLQAASESFKQFNKETVTDALREARTAWFRQRPERTGSVKDGYADWKLADPELICLESVKGAKERVRALKAALSQAEAELSAIEAKGTPRDQYVRAMVLAGSAISGLSAALHRSALEEKCFDLFGMPSVDVAQQLLETAKRHPNVRKYGGTTTLLDPNRLLYSDVELSAAFNRAVNVVESLSKAIGEA